ncbi:metallophosphoesterase [Candidatus Woesearchaeota archaeon]|nr:MAG: metallophosphoesterase [Candidatus Woesearchaeota archaeon]
MIIIVLVCVLSLYSIINAFFVHVNEFDLNINGLDKGLKIVQVSDLHIGTIRNSGYLNKVIDKINSIDPDMVFLTGDIVDGTAPLHKDIFMPFNKLNSRVFFVTGNHETYEGVEKVYSLFKGTKVSILKNEAVSFDGIQVIGVEFSQSKNHLKEVLSDLNLSSSPSILLYHSPTDMEVAKSYNVSLQLSGHTHAGQILPFRFISMLFYPQQKGLYDFGKMKLYVSPGTGTWGPYMRLGSRNEITVINLLPS